MENAFEYKQEWTKEIARRRQLQIDLPDPIPHPDDITVDMRTGHVRTEGPLDEAEKLAWDARLTRRDDAQAEVTLSAESHRKARSKKIKDRWLQEWHFEQKIFDIINDSMPDRYKAKLANRSFNEGASKEGHTLEEFRRARGKRK